MTDCHITIYITNYNYADYIEQAIESVLNQQMPEIELIIIDDGSTDHSKDIIEKYRHLDHVDIIYQQNKGLNITNNIALNLARGRYIMRLDADDFLEDGALKKLSSVLDADPELGLVFPDYYIVDKNGKKTEHHHRHDFTKEVSLYDQAAHGACTMIRTQFLRDLGGYNENYKCQDGYELWIKFVSKHKVVNITEPLFCYRQHGENLTSNENRILSTRAQINADYVSQYSIDNNAIAVIPVRSKADPLYRLEIDGISLLNIKIKEALKTSCLHKIYISSPDEEVKNAIDPSLLNNDRVIFHLRSERAARINTTLDETINEIIETYCDSLPSISCLAILDLSFPLISAEKILDAINTLLLFKSDSLISVRADSSSFFKHDGSGMKSINSQNGFSRLERDVLYRHVGGITVTRIKRFKTAKKIINGKVGHLSLDKNSSYKIENKQDLTIAKEINKLYKII